MNYDIYATHLPVLIWLGKSLNIKQVLELGCGLYSTPTFLDRNIFPNLESLQSIENNKQWADRIIQAIGNDTRFSLMMTDGPINKIINRDLMYNNYDLVFIDDSSNVEDRTNTIEAVSKYADILRLVVIHDYEQQSYQAAAKGFMNYFEFNRLIPNTGILWNDEALIDKKELEHLNK